MEKYSSGRRGAPAKGVGRVTVARGFKSSFSANSPRNLFGSGFYFLPVCLSKDSQTAPQAPEPWRFRCLFLRAAALTAGDWYRHIPSFRCPGAGPAALSRLPGARQPGIERPPVTQNMTVHPRGVSGAEVITQGFKLHNKRRLLPQFVFYYNEGRIQGAGGGETAELPGHQALGVGRPIRRGGSFMDYTATAKQILYHLGGEKNVASVTHCMTRLRFVLRDEAASTTHRSKAIPRRGGGHAQRRTVSDYHRQ